VTHQIVFDTGTVISALLFENGRLAWLRQHWRGSVCQPLVSRATTVELTRVLEYPKFNLPLEERRELLGEYLPYCRIVEQVRKSPVLCRDPKDQPFLDLAHTAKADALVTGDRDLLVLAGQMSFLIVTPEAYRHEFQRHESDE
jgi:uncharacterized protein